MSHVALVEIIVKDLDILRKAAEKIGLVFKEGQKTWKWYGKWVGDYHGADAAYKNGIDPSQYGKCEHAIGVPNSDKAYEIGVVKHPSGEGYTLLWDFWGGGYGLQAVTGDGCHKLLQEYTKQMTIQQAESEGFYVEEEVINKNGEIEITLSTGY